MTASIIVPTLDDRNSCWALSLGNKIPCARLDSCSGNSKDCTSGMQHIWIAPEQMPDYLALKLVS